MKKATKKIGSLVALVLVLCMCVCVPVFASSDSNTNTDEYEIINDSVITSIGNCIDSGSDVKTGGYCSITLHMYQSYYEPYFRAGASGNPNSSVDCSVTFPNGSTYDLGTINANGSVTPYLHYTGTAPAGDYIFEFYGSNPNITGFAAFMYSNY